MGDEGRARVGSVLDVAALTLPEVKLVTPRVHRDHRGFLVERFRRDVYAEAGIEADFLQDNHSRSLRGTVRGLHFQRPPHAQAKLVSVTRGAIFDVAVDVRRGSPTFGRWVGAVLDDESLRQLFIPPGFAHGFAVRSEVADVLYKVDAPYAPESEAGVRWNDPALDIDWGTDEPIVSAKDRRLPTLEDLDSGFDFEGASG